MNHLSDDQLYELATKIATRAAFSEADVANVHHIGQCDECYKMLCCIIAMQDISLHLDEFIVSPASTRATVPVQDNVTAVIRIAISKVKTLLEQVEANIAGWSFDAPLAIAGARSNRSTHNIHKLEDIDNSKTFVAFDPDKKVLVIQIDGCTEDNLPVVQLKMPDGSTQDVSLEKKGSVLWAEVHDLPEGEYKIFLNR